MSSVSKDVLTKVKVLPEPRRNILYLGIIRKPPAKVANMSSVASILRSSLRVGLAATTLLAFCPSLTSCNGENFKGSSDKVGNHANNGNGGPNGSVSNGGANGSSADQTAGGTDGTGGTGTNGGPGNGKSNTNGGNGTFNNNGTGSGANNGQGGNGEGLATDSGGLRAKVPLKVYVSSPASEEDDRTAVPYTLIVKSGDKESELLTYTGATGHHEGSVAGICTCGKTTEVDILVNTKGSKKSLSEWGQAVISSYSPPTDADDWDDFLREHPARGKYIAYVGAFDHCFLGSILGGSESPEGFCLDADEWNNRDDQQYIFQCDVSQCAAGTSAGTVLHFPGI